jgi:hypothetical protein
LTPKWWRKEVRELLYDTEDLLDEIIIFQAGDFSELIAGLEDACERRKRLQLAPNKTTKPDLGEAGLSYFTSQQTSVELSKPISVQGHSAGLGIVGIEDPMSKLVEQLAFDDDKQKRLKVTPIVGFPGTVYDLLQFNVSFYHLFLFEAFSVICWISRCWKDNSCWNLILRVQREIPVFSFCTGVSNSRYEESSHQHSITN